MTIRGQSGDPRQNSSYVEGDGSNASTWACGQRCATQRAKRPTLAPQSITSAGAGAAAAAEEEEEEEEEEEVESEALLRFMPAAVDGSAMPEPCGR